MMTLEMSALSSMRSKEIMRASEEFFQFREEYLKKCSLNLNKQNRHIQGKNNFKEKTSTLLISIKELEKETRPKMGMGLPHRKSLGKAGYQEFIEYGKVIGIFYTAGL